MKSCMISSGSVYFVKVRTLLWLWVVCGYKIKIYAQMLALVYISQIVPYFSLFWQFYGWHNTKSKQAHTNHRMCRRENSPQLNKLLFTLQIANEGWGGFYPHKIFKLHPTLDISELETTHWWWQMEVPWGSVTMRTLTREPSGFVLVTWFMLCPSNF